MEQYISEKDIAALRLEMPTGKRVELISMDDPFSSLQPGIQGTVKCVDDIGTIHVLWDNGSSLGLAYGEDKYRVVENDD